jgi:GcrA cell cycle regulator
MKKLNKLKELWGKGNTASQIAEIIGGISRNAVIGKAHRLNLISKNQNKNSNIKSKF